MEIKLAATKKGSKAEPVIRIQYISKNVWDDIHVFALNFERNVG